MAEKKYHCCWVSANGQFHYESFDELEPVLTLVKENAHSLERRPEATHPFVIHVRQKVEQLRVVYGELLEFEPDKIVETYKVKDTKK